MKLKADSKYSLDIVPFCRLKPTDHTDDPSVRADGEETEEGAIEEWLARVYRLQAELGKLVVVRGRNRAGRAQFFARPFYLGGASAACPPRSFFGRAV